MTPSLLFVLGFFNSSTRPHLPLPKLQKFKKDKSKSLYEQWTCGRVHVSLSVFLSLSLPFCLFQFNIECELTCFVNLFLFRFSVCFFFGRENEEGRRSNLGILCFLSRHFHFVKLFFPPHPNTNSEPFSLFI